MRAEWNQLQYLSQEQEYVAGSNMQHCSEEVCSVFLQLIHFPSLSHFINNLVAPSQYGDISL